MVDAACGAQLGQAVVAIERKNVNLGIVVEYFLIISVPYNGAFVLDAEIGEPVVAACGFQVGVDDGPKW